MMRKPPFLVHVGPHKTGSTYIQLRMKESRKALLESGLIYPNIHVSRDPGHSKLYEVFRRKKNIKSLERIFRSYECQSKSGKQIIFSSENFDRLSVSDITIFNDLSLNSMEIVYFWRYDPAFLFSWWQEEVKHGATESLVSFLYRHFSLPSQSEILNPGLVIDKYASVIEKNRIHIFNYNAIIEQNGDIADAISKYFGFELPRKQGHTARPNKALDYTTVEAIRLLNILEKRTKKRSSALPRTWLVAALPTEAARTLDFLKADIAKLSNEVAIHMMGEAPMLVRQNFLRDYQRCIRTEGLNDQHLQEVSSSFRTLDDTSAWDKHISERACKLYEYFDDWMIRRLGKR